MTKIFNFMGRVKWLAELQTIMGENKVTVMLIPPNAGSFSKKVTFVDFFDEVAERLFQTCTKDCFLNVRGNCRVYGNRIKFIGSDFQKLEFDTELGRYVPIA